MVYTRIDLMTDDGTMDCHAFTPAPSGAWSAIVFYFDAFGIRPDAFAMAERLAAFGHAVVMPNLFYRTGPFAPFSAATAFKDPAERDRLNALVATIDHAKVTRDSARLLDALTHQPFVRGAKVGCVGYCLGGQFALAAAGLFPDRVAAAASIHGGALATDGSDSPHRLFPRARARIYVAIAEHDAEFSPREAERLRDALASAGLAHEVEVYPGTRHGFAVTGRLIYDADAAERHWQKLRTLFGETLLEELP